MKANKSKKLSLRFFSRELYQQLMKELEEFHIHPYDVQATVRSTNLGSEISLRFGENFSHEATRFFTNEEIETVSDEILSFFKETGETIKQALIADYFKMVKP